MLRRENQVDRDNQDRWLISYSDFITLLFGFFVVLYSVSQVNEGKYRVLSDTLQDNFSKDRSVVHQRTLEPSQTGEITRSDRAFDDEFYENHSAFIMGEGGYGPEAVKAEIMLEDISITIISAFNELIKDDLISLSTTGEWLELRLQSNILFDSGDINVTDKAKAIFKELAFVLKAYNNEIRVAGYTDNIPIKSGNFPSNWELSAARSAAVVRLLADYGVAPERLSAVGYAEYRPVEDNATEEGRARNRRVVILVSRQEMADADILGDIDEETLIREIDTPLIKFEWDDEVEEVRELPSDIEGVQTIKMEDGGLRFTNQPRKK